MKLTKLIALLILFLTNIVVQAQGTKTEMADLMRSDGRIYVVVAVVMTILAGLLIYLIRLDNKIKKLEKE